MSRTGRDGWSATGAARAARECKASIIDFLQRSDAAVAFQANGMKTAYRVMRRIHEDPMATAMVILKAGLPVPSHLKADWQSHARAVIAQEVSSLQRAPLYVVAPSMCDVTVAAAQTLTGSDLLLMDQEDLPTPTGLVFLPHPMHSDDGSSVLHLRALGWSIHYPRYDGDDSPEGKQLPVVMLRLSMYEDTRHYSADTRAHIAKLIGREGRAVPPILLRYVSTVPFHGTAMSRSETEQFTAALQATSTEVAAEVTSESEADYVPGTVLVDADHNFPTRFAYAFFRLAEQRIAASEPAPVTHAARVVAERAGTIPDVRVIQLRVKTRRDGDGGDRAVDWSHRWVVQMHKVRQWYPSQHRNKIILRGPYVKGPAGKPLVTGEVVRALTR